MKHPSHRRPNPKVLIRVAKIIVVQVDLAVVRVPVRVRKSARTFCDLNQ